MYKLIFSLAVILSATFNLPVNTVSAAENQNLDECNNSSLQTSRNLSFEYVDGYYVANQECYYDEYEPKYIHNTRDDEIPVNTNIVKCNHLTNAITYQNFDPNYFNQETSISPNQVSSITVNNRSESGNIVTNPKSGDYKYTARTKQIFYNIYNSSTGSYEACYFVGTAFLEGPNIAVTAAHIVFGDVTSSGDFDDSLDNPRFADKIEFYFGVDGSNEINSNYSYYAEASISYIELDYSLTCELKRDWAVVELDRNIGNTLGGWYGKVSNINNNHVGEAVTSYGYPGGCGDYMYEYSGTIIQISADQESFKIDTTIHSVGGQSGSPIFWSDENGNKYVCAILSASSSNGSVSGGPFFTDFLFGFLNRYFTSYNAGYSYPYLGMESVSLTGVGYKATIINDTSWLREIVYNSKMCFYNDGINWSNLSDITSVTLNPYSSIEITFYSNFFADSLVVSYVYNNHRIITCARRFAFLPGNAIITV